MERSRQELESEVIRLTVENEEYAHREYRSIKVFKAVLLLLKGCRMATGLTELQRAWRDYSSAQWEKEFASTDNTCDECSWMVFERCQQCRRKHVKERKCAP